MFYRFAHIVVGAIYHLLYRFRIIGRENVPEGGVLVCVNHTSLADPILVALALKAKDHPRFIGKAELFRIPGFKQLIMALGAYPIERGASDMGAIRSSLKLLKEDNKVLIFPQGHRIRNDDETAAFMPGAAMLAAHSGKPLLPVYLSAGRKVLINRITVTFGTPFTVVKGADYAEQTERLRREIYALKARPVGDAAQ